MGKIILEIMSPSTASHELRVFEQPCVRIGRGFGNDVILQDPYASAEHAMVGISADGKIEITDCHSDNGVFLMSHQKIFGSAHILSGEMFVVGRTKIRVFLPEHPVAMTKKIVLETSPNPEKSLTLWYAIIGFLVLYFFEFAGRYPYEPMEVSQFIFYEFVILLGICFLAGIWALVGRLINQSPRFGQQLTLLCFFAIAMIPIRNICTYLGYAFASSVVQGIISILLAASALALLIFYQLSIATALGRRVKVISSIMVPVVLAALGFIGTIAFRNDFRTSPDFFALSKPPFVYPVKVFQSSEFISQTKEVFTQLSNKDLDSK